MRGSARSLPPKATLAEEPVQSSMLALVALVLCLCALCAVRIRSKQRHITSPGQLHAFNSQKRMVTAVQGAAFTPTRRQPLEATSSTRGGAPCHADEAGQLPRCVTNCLQSVSGCGCFGSAAVAQAAPVAALRALPPALHPSTSLPTPLSETLSPELAAHLASSNSCLAEAMPDLAHRMELISNDIEWVECFWEACGHDVVATSALMRSHASLVHDFELGDPQVDQILNAGLIEILPGGGDECAVVAVVRDIQIISHLLRTHSFHDLVSAHLMQLKRLLKTSARARRHGVSMVHDLSRLSLALVGSMLDPRNLHAQLQGARFLFTAFPVHFQTIVVVDAPPAFGMILNAVKAVAPGAIPTPLQFVSRPEAEAHCEHVFRQPVLRSLASSRAAASAGGAGTPLSSPTLAAGSAPSITPSMTPSMTPPPSARSAGRRAVGSL
jgi:hypothetical protein